MKLFNAFRSSPGLYSTSADRSVAGYHYPLMALDLILSVGPGPIPSRTSQFGYMRLSIPPSMEGPHTVCTL
jgi:hypothetical protein